MTITTPELGTQSPTSRKSAAKATPYCKICGESEMFCFCGIELPKNTLFAKQAKELQVKRIKRGTFLFTFCDVG